MSEKTPPELENIKPPNVIPPNTVTSSHASSEPISTATPAEKCASLNAPSVVSPELRRSKRKPKPPVRLDL